MAFIIGMNTTTPTVKNILHLITKKELAKRLSVSIRTIEGWMQSGRVPFYRISPRCVRFEPEQVLAQLSAYEVTAVSLRHRKSSNTLISAQKSANQSEGV